MNTKLRRLCVFCGSNVGAKEEYAEAAKQLASALAAENISLVYGGAKIGLMGVLADAILNYGGEAIGVMPQSLVEEDIAHTGISRLHIVNSMHERKALMAEISDGFILFPGGIGSLDEFFEIITWAQVGLHSKPCGILNIENYYDQLFKFLDYAVTEQFLKPVHRSMLMVENSPQQLLKAFMNYKAPMITKWMVEPIGVETYE